MTEKEELAGLVLLLGVTVGLSLSGHLDDNAVSAIEWISAAFMGSKGVQGVLPIKSRKSILKLK